MTLRSLLHRFLSLKPIAWFPVRIRGGLAGGARWTFFPWTAYWRGQHEPDVQARLLAMGDWTGRHVWDLGSHYGFFTVGLARRVGPTGSVAAFEPNPLSYRRLIHHVHLNQLSWVTTFPAAVSDSAGSSPMFFHGGMETTSSHLAYDDQTSADTSVTMQVALLRLDDLVAEGKIARPNFIKMDVEGHGHRALAGAMHTIGANRPVILTGFHSSQELEGVLRLLLPLGYRATPIELSAPLPPAVGFDYLFEPTPS